AVSDVLVPVLPGGLSDDDEAAADRARDALVAELDATAGLERVTQNPSGILWRVQPAVPAGGGEPEPVVSAWARLVDRHPAVGPTSEVAVEARGRPVETRIEAADAPRLLVLAERADPHWRATLGGRSLRAVANGWRQTFEVPERGGRLVVEHEAAQRTSW